MIGKVRWRFREVDSTQTVAFHLARLGAEHGTVVRADYQSSGRGRHGRTWESPPRSSLMFSVLLHPHLPIHQMSTLPMQVAGCLADEFGELLPDQHITIKWPNDVLVNGLKTSGILIQARDNVLVLGIGINVAMPGSSHPPGATALGRFTENPVDVEAMYDSVLARLDEMWSMLTPALSPEQVNQVNARLWLRNEMVTLQDGDRELHGRIVGVAKSGGLRLLDEGGEREVRAGEITRGPRPIDPSKVN